MPAHSCSPWSPPKPWRKVRSSAADQFRNYALSTCLADGYQADEIKKDAAAAARGYLELGGLPLEAHTEATQLGRDFLKREYASSSGQPLVLMKCIDFYQSPELLTIIRKYMRRR
ncbi:MAG TPA: T6SS amidase immunity protein Tai4 family protein [Aquabacterium sp.]|nr:T6SS amidase immunity protein Tai4 family protein [Aquabacterium sp.]